MSDDERWNERQRSRLRLRNRAWVLSGIRTLCLGLIIAVAGTSGGWGLQHDVDQIVYYAAGIGLLAFTVMMLNLWLSD